MRTVFCRCLSDSLIILTQSETWAPLNLYLMANSDNKKESVNKVANKAWSVLKWAGRVLKETGKGIVIIIALLAITFIFFNPLFFVPYTLLAPRKAAESLYDWDLPVYMDLMQCLYAPFVAVLPMYWKKHFMDVRGISDYSAKLQVKYFFTVNGEEEQIETIKAMSFEAKQLLWNSDHEKAHGNAVRVLMVDAGVKLDGKQFEFLASHSLTSVLEVYINKYTPSEEMMEILLRYRLGDLFLDCVERHGLSTRLIAKVFAMKNEICSCEENECEKAFRRNMAGLMQEALSKFSQRQMVRNTAAKNDGGDEWKCYLVKGNVLYPEAQKMMNVWQYDAYHHNGGYHLSAEAIVYFLSKADQGMCSRIFKYEPREAMNDQAQALIAANPQLLSWALAVK